MSDITEKLYTALCAQFDIPAGQNIWAGKCGLYVFWEADHFKKFAHDVDENGPMTGASAYCAFRGDGFCYIVLGPARRKDWFYEMLVHESTHAFLGRYLTNHNLPTWVHEGLADYMAATLVPGAWANQKLAEASRQVVRERLDVTHVFKEVGTNSFDYGVAQGLTRFLIARDRKGYIRFITLMKEGTSEDDALKEAFSLTHETLVRDWLKSLQAPR